MKEMILADSDLYEQVLYESLAFLIPYHFNMLRPYVDSERTETGDRLIFEHVAKLVARWESNEFLSTGQLVERISMA